MILSNSKYQISPIFTFLFRILFDSRSPVVIRVHTPGGCYRLRAIASAVTTMHTVTHSTLRCYSQPLSPWFFFLSLSLIRCIISWEIFLCFLRFVLSLSLSLSLSLFLSLSRHKSNDYSRVSESSSEIWLAIKVHEIGTVGCVPTASSPEHSYVVFTYFHSSMRLASSFTFFFTSLFLNIYYNSIPRSVQQFLHTWATYTTYVCMCMCTTDVIFFSPSFNATGGKSCRDSRLHMCVVRYTGI